MGSGKREEPEWWTFDLVREWLAEAAALWRRSPGGGSYPFATDGPWQWMTRSDQAGDYDARGGLDQRVEVEPRPLPLTRDEVALRDRISEWMRFIANMDDRRLVAMAVSYLASGQQRVPWRKVKRRLGIRFGEDGLRKRFERAISEIAKGLNAAENRK